MVGKFYPYATDSTERAALPVWFAVIAVAISYGLHTLAATSPFPLPWWVEIWSPLVIYGAIYRFFDRVAWKWRVFQVAGIVKIPNLSGHYEGTMTTSFDAHATVRPCKFEITQSWTSISVRGNFDKSKSYNLVTGISVADTPVPRLTFEYYNIPDNSAPLTMHTHDGTNWFDITRNESGALVLEGNYYTGRDRGTYGRINLRRL